MEDPGHRTVVPLLNGYKRGLATRRLLQTATGGLKLQKAPCYIHLLQLTLYFSPLLFAIPFVVLDALGVWNEYYLALVYAFIHTLAIFTLRLSVYCIRRCTDITNQDTPPDNFDEDTVEVTSCCSYGTLFFIFRSKSILSLFFHSLLLCGLLSFTSSFILLPRVLLDHLPLPAAVLVCITGWLVTCGAQYSLNVSRPHETAVYRPTDLLGLETLLRPAYLLLCATAIIAIRVTVTGMIGVQLLYAVVCVLPLCWTLGFLPPLDSLLPWLMEQTLTRLMGGSHVATDVRLLIVFLLSAFSTVVVIIIGHYSSSSAALLLAVITGYLLSQDLFLFADIILNLISKRSFQAHRKVFWHVLASTVSGCVLLITNGLLVYFSFTASDMAKKLASRVTGSCVIVLNVLLHSSSVCQRPYILGLFRNPLHPWRSEDVQKFKSWRRRLSYCSLPRTFVLTYVSPLLMLVFVTLAINRDESKHWLSAIGIARIFRKVWQNAHVAHSELFLVSLLLLMLPDSGSAWMNLGVGIQTLIVGLSLDVCNDLLLKLRFVITISLTFIFNDRKKLQHWLHVLIIVGSLPLLPLSLATILLSSIISAPLLPLFTLPIFLVSFPRTKRFWPSLVSYGSSYHKCSDSVYYQQDIHELARVLHGVFLTGSASVQPGDFYLLRYQDRILIVSILEHGHRFFTTNFRGLEMQETSCHTIEAAKIDDVFSDTYNPDSLRSLSFWFNTHPLHVMQPVDSAVIQTYSDARSILTGIIDQPPALRRFSSNLLKCIVWMLYQYLVRQQMVEEREIEGDREQERGTCRIHWRKRNKIAPQVHLESFQRATGSQPDCRALYNSPATPKNKAVTSEAKEDSLSWTSIESIEDIPISGENHSPHQTNTMCGLIPTDVPLDSNQSVHQVQSGSCWRDTFPSNSSPLQSHKLPFPSQWLGFPLLDRQMDILLSSFPSDWLSFLCDSNASELALSLEETLLFKKLCLTCFSIVDVPHCSLGAMQTRPFHLHSGFSGEFPYSSDRDWLTEKHDLYRLILKAYRYAVKLLCDEAVLGDASDCAELLDYLQGYDTQYHIGSEGEPEWNHAVLDHVPHLFSIGKSQENTTYTVRVLTLQDQLVHIGKLNSATIHAIWSDLSLELLYLTNDDEERYSIQAHPSLLRNLTIQAADPPLGYTVYSSGIVRCPCVT